MFYGIKVCSGEMAVVVGRMACENFEVVGESRGREGQSLSELFGSNKTFLGPVLDSIANNTKCYKADFLYDYDVIMNFVNENDPCSCPLVIYTLGIRDMGVAGPPYLPSRPNLSEYEDVFVITFDPEYPRLLTWKWKH